jgi:hypothetical protein
MKTLLPLLQRAKNVLRSQTIELYTMREEDLDLDEKSFSIHYANMGETLFEIEKIESFSEIIQKLESGFFNELGYYSDDDDLIEEFLKAVEKN